MTRLSALRLLPVLLLSAACARPPAADLILTNGKVYTLDWGEPAPDGTPAADAPHATEGWRPDAEAIVVGGGRIIYVGTSEEALTYRAEGTAVRDLGGAVVLPGLVDSHTHAVEMGINLTRIDVRGLDTAREVADLLRQRAGTPEPGAWVLGYGFDDGAWANRYPDMHLLDERFPDNPVYVKGLHGFAVWGNSRAFELAGIDRTTPDPEGGRIVRNERGEPTGILLNSAAALLEAALPPLDSDGIRAAVLAALDEMSRSGYVAVHEAGVDGERMRVLQEMEDAAELEIRFVAMLSARDETLCREWIASGPDRDTDSMFRTFTVKAFQDGALGSRGARLLDDYSDRPGERGTSGGEYGFDESLVEEMMAAGFQAAIHAIGDGGNRQTLDYIEGVLERHPGARGLRHRIEHAQVVHPDDFGRFAELGIIASMQPQHAIEDKTWAEERVGPERIRGAYAWRTLRMTGTQLLFNSDLPGSDHSIWYGLHSAITRRDPGQQPPGGWYPEQVMTPEEAVRGFTRWAAISAFVEDRTGILRPGYWADITVVDTDPLQVAAEAPERLLDGEVLMTIVGGRIVFER